MKLILIDLEGNKDLIFIEFFNSSNIFDFRTQILLIFMTIR